MFEFKRNHIYNTECIAGMSLIPDGAVDMILCDLPYGITDCGWDKLLPLDQLWEQYQRVIKPNGAIVLTCSQPFTTKLINSNLKLFRYCWYWKKNQVTGFPFAKFQPLRCVEDIAVFYKQAPTYNPQGLIKLDRPRTIKATDKAADYVYDGATLSNEYTSAYTNYPRQIVEFACQREGLHPTQKPVALFEYLIKTYTNEGDLVLDNCMGSGKTCHSPCTNTRNLVWKTSQQEKHLTGAERYFKFTAKNIKA